MRLQFGRIFWYISQIVFIGANILWWFTNDKLGAIYFLGVSIGFMLISNRQIIDDARWQQLQDSDTP